MKPKTIWGLLFAVVVLATFVVWAATYWRKAEPKSWFGRGEASIARLA